MNDAEFAAHVRQQRTNNVRRYRERAKAEGKTELSIFLPDDLKQRTLAAARQGIGGLRSQQAIIAAALEMWLDANEQGAVLAAMSRFDRESRQAVDALSSEAQELGTGY